MTSDGAWEDWLLYMIETVRTTSVRTLDLVRRIGEVEAALVGRTRTALGSADSEVIAVLMEQPYARTRDVIDRCGVSRPTATKWLKKLTGTGVLQEVHVGREVLYVNARLMEVLRLP